MVLCLGWILVGSVQNVQVKLDSGWDPYCYDKQIKQLREAFVQICGCLYILLCLGGSWNDLLGKAGGLKLKKCWILSLASFQQELWHDSCFLCCVFFLTTEQVQDPLYRRAVFQICPVLLRLPEGLCICKCCY